MHPLMGAVLLGTAKVDAFQSEPELYPPGCQLAQSRRPDRGERSAVIGADGDRHAMQSKQPVEDGAHLAVSDRLEMAGIQQIAARPTHPPHRFAHLSGTWSRPRLCS